jgi:hypothetical protein
MAWDGRCKKCGKKGPFHKRYRICKECCRKKTATWRKNNPERNREYDREYARVRHQENRAAVLAAYGGHCKCCGERRLVFLVIDHKNGGGNAHRRSMLKSGKVAGAANYYAWLVRNNFPKGFQVLCHNCNYAKSHGGCPHQKKAA